jgi:hypothetical protein
VETTVIVIVLGALNLLALLLLIKRSPTKKLIEGLNVLNEYVILSQKQINFVSIQLDATTKRVEAVEKVLSVLLTYGSGGGGSDGDIMH